MRRKKKKDQRFKIGKNRVTRGVWEVVVGCAKRGQTLVKTERDITHRTLTKRQ